MDVPLLASLASEAIPRLHGYDLSDIACTAWSFAKIEMYHQPLRTSIAASALASLPEFAPQYMTSIAWSCAMLCVGNQPLIKAIAQAVISRISEFDPLNLANMSWSFAKWLFAAFPEVPQAAHSVLWGTLQSNGIMNKDTFIALSDAALAQIGQFSTQMLANTAWAFAKLAVEDVPLFTAISAEFITNSSQFEV